VYHDGGDLYEEKRRQDAGATKAEAPAEAGACSNRIPLLLDVSYAG
jgi:hypothetical protein